MKDINDQAVAVMSRAARPFDSLPRHGRVGRFLATICAMVLARSAHAGETPATLPFDPTVVRGALANGVHYWIAPQAEANEVAVWMRVEAGSLQEEERESGLAHLVEHMAFRGTEHYPESTVAGRFAALGLTIGVDENAITTPRATIYKLALPRGDDWT